MNREEALTVVLAEIRHGPFDHDRVKDEKRCRVCKALWVLRSTPGVPSWCTCASGRICGPHTGNILAQHGG